VKPNNKPLIALLLFVMLIGLVFCTWAIMTNINVVHNNYETYVSPTKIINTTVEKTIHVMPKKTSDCVKIEEPSGEFTLYCK